MQFLHRQDRISLFNWLIFVFMKRGLHFATKLNSTDIQNVIVCECPPMICSPMLAKQSFPRQTATSVHRLRNTWSSLWEVICHKGDRGAEFGTTENQSREQSGRGLNAGPPDYNSSAFNCGSFYVSVKLSAYPSPKPTLILSSYLGQNVSLGEE